MRDGYDGWSATYDIEGNSGFPMRDDLGPGSVVRRRRRPVAVVVWEFELRPDV